MLRSNHSVLSLRYDVLYSGYIVYLALGGLYAYILIVHVQSRTRRISLSSHLLCMSLMPFAYYAFCYLPASIAGLPTRATPTTPVPPRSSDAEGDGSAAPAGPLSQRRGPPTKPGKSVLYIDPDSNGRSVLYIDPDRNDAQ